MVVSKATVALANRPPTRLSVREAATETFAAVTLDEDAPGFAPTVVVVAERGVLVGLVHPAPTASANVAPRAVLNDRAASMLGFLELGDRSRQRISTADCYPAKRSPCRPRTRHR